MHNRTWGAVLGMALLLACGQDAAQDAARTAELDSSTIGAAAAPAVGDLFVAQPAPADQLVFVGQDSTILPAGRDGARFVSLATFSVERDGIPNEFPPADSMAAMLEAAGVGGERMVLVGEPIPAGRAYAAFDYLGLGDRVVLLDGGPGALASGAARSSAGEDRAQLDIDVREDMIVDAAWVHARLDDPDVVILDARPPAEYRGDTPGEGIERPGHIPGARNVFWQNLVHSIDDPRLKHEAELRGIFEEAGVGPEDTIVSYCRTGGQASFLYVVARHLGYDVRLYDGSFVDWSRTDYPVER